MNPLHPLYFIIILAIAWVSGFLIKKISKVQSTPLRYEAIDGLRGILVCAVFTHHSSVWYQYLHTGTWNVTTSYFINFVGQASVSFFFMITSFLFVSRLLQSPNKPFAWKSFFVGRLFRLVPMYYFSVLLIILFVFIISKGQLQTTLPELGRSLFQWAVFTVGGVTWINQSPLTSIINAGVEWTLPYEWLFYINLPIIAFFILKKKPHWMYYLLGIAFIFLFYYTQGIAKSHIAAFGGGILAAILFWYFKYTNPLKEKFSLPLIILCLILLSQTNYAYGLVSVVLCSIIFCLIAMGASFGGLLKNPILKYLGEISYSTYLLHGALLFGVFYFMLGIDNMKSLSPWQYSLLVFLITPILVMVSGLGFRYIEKPFMQWGILLIEKIKKKHKDF